MSEDEFKKFYKFFETHTVSIASWGKLIAMETQKKRKFTREQLETKLLSTEILMMTMTNQSVRDN